MTRGEGEAGAEAGAGAEPEATPAGPSETPRQRLRRMRRVSRDLNWMGRVASALHLGIDVQKAQGDLRPTLLGMLRDGEFLPDPTSHEALLGVAGRPLPPNPLLLRGGTPLDRWAMAGAEDFASRFFDLSVAERRAAWRGMSPTMRLHPAAWARFKALKPGLSVDPKRIRTNSPALRRLVDDAVALFPLDVEARVAASRDRAYLFDHDPNTTRARRWAARKWLRLRHPRVARLVPDHLARFGRPGLVETMSRAAARVGGLAHMDLAAGPKRLGGLSRNGWMILVWLVIFAGGLGRLVSRPGPARPGVAPSPTIRQVSPPIAPAVRGPTPPPTSGPPSAAPATSATTDHQARVDRLTWAIRREVANRGYQLPADVDARLAGILPVTPPPWSTLDLQFAVVRARDAILSIAPGMPSGRLEAIARRALNDAAGPLPPPAAVDPAADPTPTPAAPIPPPRSEP